MKKIIIVAIARNNVIGRSDGKMPWHSKEDFLHFKNTTVGNPVIMGRKTFESLGKPLKGRLNIIITRAGNNNYGFDNIKILHSLSDAYEYCEKNNYEKIFIIGGGQIYRQAMDTADEMVISFMNFEAAGDIFFPVIDESLWEINNVDKREEFKIVYYMRKTGIK